MFVRASGCCLGVETTGEEKGAGQDCSGQAWCYVVGLVFPHVAFLAQRNEWLPTGLWPWPRLKEYTYQGPEYTPQPASQPACVLAFEHSPTTSPPATDWLSHTLSHQLHPKGLKRHHFICEFLHSFCHLLDFVSLLIPSKTHIYTAWGQRSNDWNGSSRMCQGRTLPSF